jgi:hypothetical protein
VVERYGHGHRVPPRATVFGRPGQDPGMVEVQVGGRHEAGAQLRV